MTECIRCRDDIEHEYLYEIVGPDHYVPMWAIHEIEHCAYYLCKELGDKCPNCCITDGNSQPAVKQMA
jgi:hypothetical protein